MISPNNHLAVWIVVTMIVCGLFVRQSDSSYSSKTKGSRDCSAVMDNVMESAYSGVDWALEMVDASFKPPVGISRLGIRFVIGPVPPGSIQFLGNFDQCLDIKPPEDFGTLYCKVHLHVERFGNTSFSPPKDLYVDVCAPDLCQGDDLVPFAKKYVKQVPGLSAVVKGGTCLPRSLPYTYKAIVVMCILSLILLLVAMGTVYDVVILHNVMAIFRDTSPSTNTNRMDGEVADESMGTDKEPTGVKSVPSDPPGEIGQLLLPFSLYTNLPELMSPTVSKGTITCINGLRFVTVLWIVFGHFINMSEPAGENIDAYEKKMNPRWYFQPVRMFNMAVDTFFSISGLLLTYKTMKELQNSKPSLTYFKDMFVHRYMRLTPAYVLILATHVSLFKYLSDGPFWPYLGMEQNECEDSWWFNFLYINNLGHNFLGTCMVWSWSLATEMQFFVFSPVVLLALYYYNWRGISLPIFMLTSNIAYTASVSYIHHLMALPDILKEGFVEYFYHYYLNPLVRISPYLIGMMTGYLLYKTDLKPKLSKRMIAVGWTVSAVSILIVFSFLYCHTNGASNEMTSLYNAFHRPLWSVAICWIIFTCASGYGGILNTFLSWKFFVPFSTVSYCSYLIHMDVMSYFFFFKKTKILYGQHQHYVQFSGGVRGHLLRVCCCIPAV